jgi:hypothetical protein
MTTRRPNKKRNALLVFEFLTKEASRRVVAGDTEGAERVIALIKESFAPSTELHRELRLARSLSVTRVSSSAVAAHILTEARSITKAINADKLHAEKTKLITRVEREVDPSGIVYEEQLPNYRLLNTIGTLISDWRSGSDDLTRIAAYEDQLMEHLTAPVAPPVVSDDPADSMSPGERRALIAIMSRKLEEKWGAALTKDQKALLREYVLAKEPAVLLERLRSIQATAVKCLDECRTLPENTEYFLERVADSKRAVAAHAIDEVNDETVGLGLLYLKLIAEAAEEESR